MTSSRFFASCRLRRQELASLLAGLLVTVAPARPASAQGVPPPDARAEALLREMTLEEKLGEMTQLTIGAVSGVQGTPSRAQQLDSAKLENALVRRHVGSLLNVWDVALSPAQWRELTTTVQRFAARKRLPIPVIFGIDAVHGHHYMTGSTVFPQNIAMAATWNPALVKLANRITTYEARASGIPWNFSPVLDVARTPLWPRVHETFGEDVHLASVMGVAAVEGSQEDPTPAMESLLEGAPLGEPRLHARVVPDPHAPLYVAATAKHFLGYSMPLSGHDRTTAWIPDRQLREYFLPSFKAAIDAGVATVMVNSADVNGVPVHASHELLTDLLRTELGFRGVVVTDWEDIVRLNTVHRVAPTTRDAVRMAIDAGVDMSMVPYNTSFIDDALALVRAGQLSVARIDESVRRILRLKLALGLFDDALPRPAHLANAGAPRARAVSRVAAEEAITLLRNERDMLPLSRNVRVLVTGPAATSLPAQHGGWTYTWQGTTEAMYPKDVKTLLDAVRDRVGADRLIHVAGASLTAEDDVAAAVAAAKQVDVAIVALAEPAGAEKPADIDDLALPAAQLRLARAIEATGTPVVVTLFEGRPRIIREIVDGARAIVLGYQTGPFGGEALAEVLFGEVNPSGRLPYTYPRAPHDLVPYDRLASADVKDDKPTGGYHPEWPFGFGLSYTTFAYGDLTVDGLVHGPADTVTVRVDVRNVGSRAGMDVVQLYVRQLYGTVDPPVRRLRDFRKVALAPGERRTVTFRLPVSRLAVVGRGKRMAVERGEYRVLIADLSAPLQLR